jgi:hypothetical protein
MNWPCGSFSFTALRSRPISIKSNVDFVILRRMRSASVRKVVANSGGIVP